MFNVEQQTLLSIILQEVNQFKTLTSLPDFLCADTGTLEPKAILYEFVSVNTDRLPLAFKSEREGGRGQKNKWIVY